ncbi:MAG: hypothetical protein Q9M89_10260 [Persephonella sp.]|nr:hypothetical protein [Persephonella sp.]
MQLKQTLNLSILKIFRVDWSGHCFWGELYRGLKAGFDPKKIVYAGAWEKQMKS